MSRLPSWVIVAAVGIVLALAAADAIRPHSEASRQSSGVEPPVDLQGVLLVASEDCSTTALRLPDLKEESLPFHPDCNGIVWSHDGTLAARCTETNGTEILTERLEFTARVPGCAPAWRPDGALTVIHDGDLVLWRRRGAARTYLSAERLASALDGQIDDGGSYRLAEVAWHGTVAFVAIVEGSKPGQQAVIAYTPEGVTGVFPELGRHVSGLRVSPAGTYIAFNRSDDAGREIVMLDASGREIPLPRVANVHGLAWSPDESWVALMTRTTTFFARTGTRRVVQQIPVGGESLAWLP
jgi:hypothetical protein